MFKANVFDHSSDIGVIISLYLLGEKEQTSDCQGINSLYLFYLSIAFFLLYRIVSGIAVYIGTRNKYFSVGQFLIEFMIYRAIWVNYILQCDRPCSPQQWLQNMEAMLEAFPQLIIQMFFLIQTTGGNNDSSDIYIDIDGTQLFVLFSIMFSILSLTNKAVSEDRPLFNELKWQQAKWKCKPPFIKKNPQYLIRVLFRIFDVSSRVIIIVLVWSIFGGFILSIIGGIEFTLLIVITLWEKDQTCLTWIVVLPINFFKDLQYIHFIIAIFRLIQYLTFVVLIFIHINNGTVNTTTPVSLSYYALVHLYAIFFYISTLYC